MRILLSIVLSIAFIPSYAQMELAGVKLPSKLSNGKEELNLNGGGIRKKYFIKVYVAALYSETKNKDAQQIINADKPMGVRIQVVSSLVTSDNMAEPIREGFSKSLNGKTATLQSKIDAFIKTFTAEEINEGDTFDLWYIPGTGVKSYKNGKYKSTVSGLDFKRALFGIWLGKDPVDEDLKDGLLGR